MELLSVKMSHKPYKSLYYKNLEQKIQLDHKKLFYKYRQYRINIILSEDYTDYIVYSIHLHSQNI